MVTDTREIELKYEIGPDARLPPLEDLPRVASAAGPDEQKLEAEYYDTEDLRLLRAGVTLRRRRRGNDRGWQLERSAGRGGPCPPSWPGWSRCTAGARRWCRWRGSRPCGTSEP